MKGLNITAILLLCFTLPSHPQDAKHNFVSAEYYFLNDDYEKALPLYLENYKTDTSNYNLAYRIGRCYENIPLKIFDAIPYLEAASRNVNRRYREGSFRERKANVDALYQLGFVYQMVKRFDDAIIAYDKFRILADVKEVYAIDEAERRIESSKRCKEMIKKPRWVEIENIGNIVNSKYSELNPCVSANDSVMVFSRLVNRVQSADMAFINKYQVLQSIKKDKAWGDPVEVTGDMRSNGEYLTVSMSPNGKRLLLYRDEFETGGVTEVEHGTLYQSQYVDGKWSSVKNLGNPVNTINEETSGWISDDGNTLIFSSDRKGGVGGLDLWKSTRQGGGWSEPQNMGPVINSAYDEEYPFLVNDTMLYFCSDGHDNLGGTDVFYCKKMDTTWSSPVNMSYPINSPSEDVMFVPVKDGKVAYYSVERHEGYITFGKADIYRIVLDPRADMDSLTIDSALKPIAYVPIQGVLKLDDNSILSPEITITVTDQKTSKTVVQTKPNYETGEFALNLPPGDYRIEVEGDHYDKTIQNLYISPDGNTNARFDVKMIPKQVASGEYFKIRAIFFDFAKWDLTHDAQVELERVLNLMNANPSLYIEVVGFTDSKGSVEYNKKLSIKRSKAVVDYLSAKGIDASRFVSKGMGEDNYVAINENPDGTDNPEGRKLNRRVEMRVLKSDNQNIITEGIDVPDNLKYKGLIRYSIIVAREDKKLDDHRFDSLYAKKMIPRVFVTQDSGKYIYYTGDFKDKASAVGTLNKIIELGFDKAEMTDYFKLNRMSELKVTKTSDKSSGRYVVQLRAQMKPCDVAKAFKSVADVKQVLGDDGYYRYYTGDFASRKEASLACEKIRDQGYVDAFVVDYAKYQYSSTKLVSPATYTIQVLASRKSTLVSTFAKLDGVEEKKGQDGFYRYIVGRYTSWNQAQSALDDVRSKGFPGAFISNTKKYE